MKAWLVEDRCVDDLWNDDDRGQYQIVVHAETRNQARQEGFKYLHNTERYIDLRCRRCPGLDDLPVTDWNLYDRAGWEVECLECGRLINQDRWDYENDVPMDPCEGPAGEALCSARCRDDWQRRVDHSCWIAWRGVVTEWGKQRLVPFPRRERDRPDFDAMWRIVDADERGYWKLRVPA